MELLKSDLQNIGHTAYKSKDGFLQILCNPQTANIEEILLRNILKLFGDYEITNVCDFIWGSGLTDIKFTTNLPFEFYE